MSRRGSRWRVWFHRTRAIAWAVVGLVSFPLGWADNIAVVWIASVYANALTDWGAGEAADDREIVDRLNRIEALLKERGDQP